MDNQVTTSEVLWSELIEEADGLNREKPEPAYIFGGKTVFMQPDDPYRSEESEGA